MRRIATPGVLVVLAAVGAMVLITVETSPAEPPHGPPLTKEEYGERYLELSDLEARITRLEAQMYLDELPRRRCAAKLKRLHHSGEKLTREADEVVPPPEISALHEQLVDEGERIGRAVGKLRRRVTRGRVVCGYERSPNVSEKLHDIYYSGPLDGVIDRLYARGYFPGGY